jgi:hypothetical protein
MIIYILIFTFNILTNIAISSLKNTNCEKFFYKNPFLVCLYKIICTFSENVEWNGGVFLNLSLLVS